MKPRTEDPHITLQNHSHVAPTLRSVRQATGSEANRGQIFEYFMANSKGYLLSRTGGYIHIVETQPTTSADKVR